MLRSTVLLAIAVTAAVGCKPTESKQAGASKSTPVTATAAPTAGKVMGTDDNTSDGNPTTAGKKASVKESCRSCIDDPVLLRAESGSCEVEIDYSDVRFLKASSNIDCANDVPADERDECERDKQASSQADGLCGFEPKFDVKECSGSASKSDVVVLGGACDCTCESDVKKVGKTTVTARGESNKVGDEDDDEDADE